MGCRSPSKANGFPGGSPSSCPPGSFRRISAREHQTTVPRTPDNGRLRSYSYDPAGRLTLVTAAPDPPTVYGYDARGRLTTSSEGSRTLLFHHDEGGTPTGLTTARGHSKQLILDGFGRTIGEIEPNGVTTISQIDATGRPTDTRVIRESGSNRYLLRWNLTEFDASGRVIKETHKLFDEPLLLPVDGSDPEGAVDVVTRWIYEDENRLQRVIDPRGGETVTELDELGRVHRITDPIGNSVETEYEANGNKRSETITEVTAGGAVSVAKVSFEYDDQNRLIAVSDVSDPVRPATTRYAYDLRGNRIEEVDPDGRRTRFEYDLEGNRVRQVAADGGVTRWRYDENGRLEAMLDARGNETRYEYDEENDLTKEIRADGATWRFEYDANRNRVKVIDPNGTTVAALYDESDRLTGYDIERGAGVGGPTAVRLRLDELGRLVSAETSEGVKNEFTWDSLDRQTSESMQIGNGPVRRVTRSFDAGDHVSGTKYPSGLQLAFDVDAAGRLSSISDPSGLIGSYGFIGHRLRERVLANGISEQWSYDPRRRLERITTGDATATALREIAFERLLSGRKRTITRPDLRRRWLYEFDPNGWISSEVVEWLEGESGGLIRGTDYEIDSVLNYRTVTETRFSSTPPEERTTQTVVNARNQYTGFGEQLLRYDANGNLTEFRGMVLQYDFENRFKKATLADGALIEYLYDGLGRRVRERAVTAGGTRVTDYVHDGDRVIEEIVNDRLNVRHVHGPKIDELLRTELGGNHDGSFMLTLFPLQDEMANVERLTDTTGATLERYEYSGYGRFRVFDEEDEERSASAYAWRHLFHGRPHDPLLDAYDFRARVLWPEIGRFGQEDPLGTVDSLNLFQAFGLDWHANRDPYGTELMPGEWTGPGVYNFITGTKAHNLWDRWIAANRHTEMGFEGDTAFYNKSVNTILRRRLRDGRVKAAQHGNKRPDAARIERDTSVTVWELKPVSYDPAFGDHSRHAELVAQLAAYRSALSPSNLGNSMELHPSFADYIGEVVTADGKAYEMTAYLGLGANRGVVFYRLDHRGRRSQSIGERVLSTATDSAPCIGAHLATGLAAGAIAGAAVGAAVGATGGTLVAPGVGTVGGGGGGALVGGATGAAGGAATGLAQALIACAK
jgi:RHS repeat-associated protein